MMGNPFYPEEKEVWLIPAEWVRPVEGNEVIAFHYRRPSVAQPTADPERAGVLTVDGVGRPVLVRDFVHDGQAWTATVELLEATP